MAPRREGGGFDGGALNEEEVVLLVGCGTVPGALMRRIERRLSEVLAALPPGAARPGVALVSRADPPMADPYSEEWRGAFAELARALPPAAATIIVTRRGAWDDACGRFMLAVVAGGAAVVSTRRFEQDPARMAGRLEKEVLKGLGMALGLPACPGAGCVMRSHRHCSDLDAEGEPCPRCRSAVATGLGRRMRGPTRGRGA